jgi:DNA-binding NarL/FixJ family response regulator
MKKLTLSADPDVIAEAHRLAQSRGTSVSAMFSRFVKLLSQRDREHPPIGRLTKRATGIIRLPEGHSERDVLQDALAEKHGL